MTRIPLILLLITASSLSPLPSLNDRPILGILSLPNEGDYPYNGTSFIDAGYVKWIEMAGARVVPLIIDHSWTELEFLISHLDGVLFTGGDKEFFTQDGDFTFYASTACHIYDLVKSLNDEGQYYPIWGTCLGFQLLHVCVNRNNDTVQSTPDMPGHSATSNFTHAGWESRVFNDPLGKSLQRFMTYENVTFVSHNAGILPEEYSWYRNLSDTYRVLSTMRTIEGVEYVGMIEGIDYPIYGSQFHPEKNVFEWYLEEAIPHSFLAVKVTTYFADFLVNEARKNTNTFSTDEEVTPYLIYNWAPYFWNQDPLQVYIFT